MARGTNRPVFISGITIEQKRTLNEKALELALAGDFSGITAMSALEANHLTRKATEQAEVDQLLSECME